MTKKNIKNIIVENIILDIDCGDFEAIEKAKERLQKINVSQEILSTAKIYKKSIDTRHKNNIKLVYSVAFDTSNIAIKDFNGESIKIIEQDSELEINSKIRQRDSRPVVIGFGPSGMFCALLLSMYGCKPIVFEMGEDIDGRIKKVDRLFKEGILDEKTNVCFGEGGAGTFSDGKLITRIGGKGKARSFVMRKLTELGAPEDILYNAKPHVGTDKIRIVTKNIRNEIIKNGGEIYFNAELTDICPKTSSSVEIVINNSEKFLTEGLFLAIGHSAFKTYDILLHRGFVLEPKPYSVGLRIEHTQEYIDGIVYGRFAGHKNLPHAEYSLSHIDKEITKSAEKDSRGVYTFCMCPGGAVVNSATENGGIVTNGMSYSDRNLQNANAAIAVSIFPADYGNSIDGAFTFRRDIEEAAFKIKNSGFAAPVQTLGNFMDGRTGGVMKSSVKPSYTGNVTEYDINKLLPDFVCKAIKTGIFKFDRVLKGYYSKDAVLTAPETRTSSAVRITRNGERLTAINFDCVYPMGEGAGYAGGITSSAADGVSCALAYLNLE